MFSSVAQLYLTLCNSMDCSMPGFPVHHQLPEFTQTHVHWVDDAIQPSHPLLSPILPSIFPSIRVFSNESVLHFNSVQFSCSVMSESLWPHELQHARPPCPSPTPEVYPNSPAISSSVVLFSSCPQSLPASGPFAMSQLFTWGGQSIGVSASPSVLPVDNQGWSPLEWTGWISLQSKGLQEYSPTPQFKSNNSLALSFLRSPTLTSIHDHWKNHRLD